MTEAATPQPGIKRLASAGLSANLVGIGLARFAYTPLIPVLIDAAWFTPAEAAYLGALNLIGYLAGALAARPLGGRWPAAHVLRAMMTLATVAFLACALNLGFPWFGFWRFDAGVAGGVIMALAAPTVLPYADPARRGLTSGVLFAGVGVGVAASGTLVPLLLGWGLVATWCGLGALSALLTAAAWRNWPRRGAPTAPPAAAASAPRAAPATRALLVEYGLNAAGQVPHMVFLVDFIVRGLERDLATGAQVWVLYGLGAMLGPLLTGRAADRIGFATMLRAACVIQIAAIALLFVSTATPALAVSSLLVGGLTPGLVPVVFGRVQELTRDAATTQRVWSGATTAFALGQALGAAVCAELFARTGSHLPLFGFGIGALVIALALDVVWGRRAAPARAAA
jgi:predicted MFS family arabinose efflux permease